MVSPNAGNAQHSTTICKSNIIWQNMFIYLDNQGLLFLMMFNHVQMFSVNWLLIYKSFKIQFYVNLGNSFLRHSYVCIALFSESLLKRENACTFKAKTVLIFNNGNVCIMQYYFNKAISDV